MATGHLLSHSHNGQRRLTGIGILLFVGGAIACVALEALPDFGPALATILAVILAIVITVMIKRLIFRVIRSHSVVQATPDNPTPVQPAQIWDIPQWAMWIIRLI